MQRRSALKSLTAAVGGLMSLPSWAQAWTPETVKGPTLLTMAEEDTLAEIVETIIPETSTPGAKSLKVHQLIDELLFGNARKNTPLVNAFGE